MQKKYQREQVSQSLTSEDYQKRISFQNQFSLVSIEVVGSRKTLRTGLSPAFVLVSKNIQVINKGKLRK